MDPQVQTTLYIQQRGNLEQPCVTCQKSGRCWSPVRSKAKESPDSRQWGIFPQNMARLPGLAVRPMLAAKLPLFPPIVEKIEADMILQFYSSNRYGNEVVNQFLVLSYQFLVNFLAIAMP